MTNDYLLICANDGKVRLKACSGEVQTLRKAMHNDFALTDKGPQKSFCDHEKAIAFTPCGDPIFWAIVPAGTLSYEMSLYLCFEGTVYETLLRNILRRNQAAQDILACAHETGLPLTAQQAKKAACLYVKENDQRPDDGYWQNIERAISSVLSDANI